MIDLIKQIKALKEEYNWQNLHCRERVDIENETIDKVLQILNQYNIITAPKTIKLSEIVNKFSITNSFYKNHRISVIRDGNDIDIWEDYDIEIEDTTLSQSYLLVVINTDKIEEINNSCRHEKTNKWLYTLWIAGTKIIDDLEGSD